MRYTIELYWEPTTPECGVWDRSSDHPDTYTEEEADAIIARGRRFNRGYRRVEAQ